MNESHEHKRPIEEWADVLERLGDSTGGYQPATHPEAVEAEIDDLLAQPEMQEYLKEVRLAQSASAYHSALVRIGEGSSLSRRR